MWDTIGWIVSSKPRTHVLQATDSGPITPTEISDQADIRIEYVSRALSELSDKELVECLNPDAHKGRLYTITEEGKKIRSKMEQNDL